MKSKDFKSFIEKFNSHTYKKIKKYNILNQPRKSLLFTSSKKRKNVRTFNNTDNKKIDYSNNKFNKNISLLKESIINKSSTLRNSFKSSIIKLKILQLYYTKKASKNGGFKICLINYFVCNLLTARVNLDFFLAAVFLCKTPLETALSHN